MKKFITTLAATLVIGSAASAATPTFNVYHEEVLPALAEANTPATFSVYHEEVLPALVAANTPPTFNVVREEILPAMVATVANYNWEALPDSEHLTIDADPFAEEIVGGIGPQLPYDPMRGVDYGFVQALKQLAAETVADYNWDAMPTSERITSVTVANYNWEALPASERVPSSAMVVYNFDALPAAERTDVETFSVAGN